MYNLTPPDVQHCRVTIFRMFLEAVANCSASTKVIAISGGHMKKINHARMLWSRVELDYLLTHPEDQDFRDGLLEPDRHFTHRDSWIARKLLSCLNKAGGMRSSYHR